MKTRTVYLVILVAGLIACVGCGTGTFSHEIDVVLESEPGGTPVTEFEVAIGGGFRRESASQIPLHSAGSKGLVHLDYQEQMTLGVWQKRPGYVGFELYIPGVSTNGSFCFIFDKASVLPTRGLKRGKVDIRPWYCEFDRGVNEGWRTLPTIHTEVLPSEKGGYHIKLHLPVRALREGMTAEFVPYNPDAPRKN